MARRKDPKLRHHKATGQAVVAIQGTQIYLGKFGTREAERRYHLVLSDPQAARAKWLKTHQKVDVDNPRSLISLTGIAVTCANTLDRIPKRLLTLSWRCARWSTCSATPWSRYSGRWRCGRSGIT